MAKNWFEAVPPLTTETAAPVEKSSPNKEKSGWIIPGITMVTAAVIVVAAGGFAYSLVKGDSTAEDSQPAQVLAVQSSDETQPSLATASKRNYVSYAGSACRDTAGEILQAGYENVSQAAVAFEQAYIQGDTSAIITSWSPTANMSRANWTEVTSQFHDATWCLQLEPEIPGEVSGRLEINQANGQKNIFDQKFIGEFIDGRWLIKEIKEMG